MSEYPPPGTNLPVPDGPRYHPDTGDIDAEFEDIEGGEHRSFDSDDDYPIHDAEFEDIRAPGAATNEEIRAAMERAQEHHRAEGGNHGGGRGGGGHGGRGGGASSGPAHGGAPRSGAEHVGSGHGGHGKPKSILGWMGWLIHKAWYWTWDVGVRTAGKAVVAGAMGVVAEESGKGGGKKKEDRKPAAAGAHH